MPCNSLNLARRWRILAPEYGTEFSMTTTQRRVAPHREAGDRMGGGGEVEQREPGRLPVEAGKVAQAEDDAGDGNPSSRSRGSSSSSLIEKMVRMGEATVGLSSRTWRGSGS
jgi:hypothetical protein